jgi:N-acetylmuramoyl-L-alanine amidase
MNIPKYLIVHHTGGTDANPLADTSNHTAKDVDAWHKAKGWDGIGYNWYIEKSGLLKKGRDEDKTGAHAIGYNDKSIGICLAGNFDATMPTEAQKLTLAGLLRDKMNQYSIPKENIVPHRKFATKTCYGKKLSDTWARDLLTASDPLVNLQIPQSKVLKAQQFLNNL